MTSLNVSSNKLLTKEAGKALSDALANSTLKELDVSSNNWRRSGSAGPWMGDGSGFASELAVGLSTNGALAKFTFSGDGDNYDDGPPVTIETSMTEADFSNKALGVSGAIMLAAFLPKCR